MSGAKTLADGRMYEGEILGHDQTTDLAVVRLKNPPSDLTVATFGSSKDLSVGDEVMAVGAPLGLSNTVTTGIISALNRPVVNSQSEDGSSGSAVYTNAIQIDAAINPGNSGGPLFNSKGEVIAINSQIYSRSGAFNGLAFSIPINMAKNIADQLKDKGEVVRGWLGVRIQGLDQTLAESFGMNCSSSR